MGNELYNTLTLDDPELRLFMPVDLENEESPFMITYFKEEKKSDVSNVQEMLRRSDSKFLGLL